MRQKIGIGGQLDRPQPPLRVGTLAPGGERAQGPRQVRRPPLVLRGSVRRGDWAVAGERFGGGAGVCEPLALGGALFQFLEVAQY